MPAMSRRLRWLQVPALFACATGATCEAGGGSLCSCSELIQKKLIESINDCTQVAAVAACKAGTCKHDSSTALRASQSTLPYKYHNPQGPFDLLWGFPTDDTIEIEMTLPTSFYLGIGLTADGIGDTIAGWVDESGTAVVGDYWDAGSRQPETDESRGCRNDIRVVSGSRSGAFSTIRFRRKLNTHDKEDCDVVITKSPMQITYAWCDEPACADLRGCKAYEDGCIDMPHSLDAAGFATIDFSGQSRSDDVLVT